MEKAIYEQLVKETARNIHDFIYNNIKLSDNEHATFIAGCLIALQDDTFRQIYKVYKADDANYLIQAMMSAIEHSILNCKGFDKPEKQDIVKASTGFAELDRVLGGGLVKGSLTLLGRRARNWKIYFNTSNM